MCLNTQSGVSILYGPDSLEVYFEDSLFDTGNTCIYFKISWVGCGLLKKNEFGVFISSWLHQSIQILFKINAV